MGVQTVLIYHSPTGREVPALVRDLADASGLRVQAIVDEADVLAAVNRSYPAGVVVDAHGGEPVAGLCGRLKSDAFTAVVPVVVLAGQALEERLAAIRAGADEVVSDGMDATEVRLRVERTLERATRDVGVHPTTRLPGTVQIERDIGRRLAADEIFACCYADLDHFKEFNDRYGYNRGDGVIKLLSRILRDIVKACAPDGFIGHIGGDDFIFNVPLDAMVPACELIVETFEELIPYQYSEQDRRAGYFLGKDRRGNLHRVPLMTLSIGVVTTRHRKFAHTGRVSELATEMKAYAKTLGGSVYAVDRRHDPVPGGRAADRPDEPRDERSLSKL